MLAVFVGAWRWRPAAGRLVAFVEAYGPGPPSLVAGRSARFGVEPRRRSPGDDPSRTAGRVLAALGTLLALLVSPLAGLVVAAALITGGRRWPLERRRRQAEEVVAASVPEAIDLFALVAGAGHPVRRSLHLVASRAGGPVGRELGDAVRRVDHGERTADALEQVAANLGESVRPLDRRPVCLRAIWHAPGPCARASGIEARVDRRRRAEEAGPPRAR